MRAISMINLRGWLETRIARKLGLWLILSLVLSVIFFRDFWTSLPVMLSPDWIFGRHHAAPWGVLALCLIFLWLKRKAVWDKIGGNPNLAFIPIGLGLIAGAILMPSSVDFLVFQVLLASLGVFIILFGKAAKIPSIILAVYGFAISFPLAIQRFAEETYSRGAIVPLMGILHTFGYPIQNEGQLVHFTSTSGESISVAVTSACAGPVTMGVFIALFALMTLDMPLPPKKGAGLFLFGAVGTWLQSLIRLIAILLVGYYMGSDALWTAHFWTIYILFPLWYLLFAYIYFRQLRGLPGAERKQKIEYAPAGVR